MSDLPPGEPKPLEYATPAKPEVTPVGAQGCLGVMAAFITIGLAVVLLRVLPSRRDVTWNVVLALGLPGAALIAVSFYAKRKWRFRGFDAGVLIGFALSCLIFVGLCFTALSHI